MLHKNSFMADHDYEPTAFPGVVRAVDETFRSCKDRFSGVEIYRDTTWSFIPSAVGLAPCLMVLTAHSNE
jgi:hypothetical protein